MAEHVKTENAATLAGIFANYIRLSILEHLMNGPSSVGDISTAVHHSQPVVSKQLSLLRRSGLLECRPDGRWREYALLERDMVKSLIASLHSMADLAAVNAAKCRKMKESNLKENHIA